MPCLRHRDLVTSFLTGLQKDKRNGETKVNAYNRLDAAHSLDLYGSVKCSAQEEKRSENQQRVKVFWMSFHL